MYIVEIHEVDNKKMTKKIKAKESLFSGDSEKSPFDIFLHFSYKEEITFFYMQVSDFPTQSIEVTEYASLHNNKFWNYNNFYCDLSAFEQHSRFRAFCIFWEAIPSPPLPPSPH